ncbi:unnamed protein product [Orchesella dallaii]|uniref:Uncharacterized protein n=1 Tax=Orchesella dallaii TaxID=48710 RepID=A0ABP1PNH5_9HEXA
MALLILLLKNLFFILLATSSVQANSYEKINQNDCFLNTIVTANSVNNGKTNTTIDILHPDTHFAPTLLPPTTSRTLYTHKEEWFNVMKIEKTRDANLTTYDGFWRFIQKHREPCVIFEIVPATVNDTLEIMYGSGYSSSKDILFIINILSSDFVDQFDFELQSWEDGEIHTNIVFVQTLENELKYSSDKNYFTIYCHLCHEKKVKWKSTHMEVTLQQLVSFSNKINSRGHGSSSTFYTMYKWDLSGFYHRTCFSTSRNVISNLWKCYTSMEVIFSIIERQLNVTFRATQSSVDDDIEGRHGLKVAVEIPWIIDNFIEDRAEILVNLMVNRKLMYCKHINESIVKWDTYISPFDSITWTLIGSSIIMYAILYKNIWRGLDLMWPFFDKEPQFAHCKVNLGFALISTMLLSFMYQAVMSTELLMEPKLETISTVKELIDLGYKARLNTPELLHMAESILNSSTFYQRMFWKFGKYYVRDITYVDRCLEECSTIRKELDYVARRKSIIVLTDDDPVLKAIIGMDFVTFDGKFCKAMDFGFPPHWAIFSSWSHLSKESHKVATRTREHGIMEKWERIREWVRFLRSSDNLKLHSMWFGTKNTYLSPKKEL